jgi:EAL domain-containing protein (putative c-di-GMP-specific phosphodiesterase class I)
MVAEGVETPKELERLHALGCDEIQGCLYKRSPAAADAAAFIARDEREASRAVDRASCAPNSSRVAK